MQYRRRFSGSSGRTVAWSAALGIAGGIWLSRTLRSKYGIGVRKPDTKPPVYASRQHMRKAEREKAKKEAR